MPWLKTAARVSRTSTSLTFDKILVAQAKPKRIREPDHVLGSGHVADVVPLHTLAKRALALTIEKFTMGSVEAVPVPASGLLQGPEKPLLSIGSSRSQPMCTTRGKVMVDARHMLEREAEAALNRQPRGVVARSGIASECH
jgi:hypothetical protein